MYPEIGKIGPIPIHSFGLMVAIAFLTANYLFTKEVKRRGYGEDVASVVTFFAFIGGLLGAKLFHLLENFNEFLANPVESLFNPGGLTFYGGLILSITFIYIYSKRKKINFLTLADAAAPSLILAYGIGRIGCQLAGDGDYGIPTNLPWAMGYPNGYVSTLSAKNMELVEYFKHIFPGSAVPVDIKVHPAPVYETLISVVCFVILWKFRKKPNVAGWLFGLYLILAGLERFGVEFIRINPLYAGLSQAQWISIVMMLLGSWMMWKKLETTV
ncbi:MAG: prolipoprotein diacylglyceryl transferase [Bacteroidetes bacterium]|nr:prolipoprotein diacylglyceryl transferase [Bacteroidota bacterium]